MPIRFKHGIEVDGSVTVDGQSLGSNAFNSTTIPTHTSNLTNDSGFITQAAGDLRYLRGVPSETGYNIQLLPCAIEIYDQTTGGDLSWVVGADDRGGVGQVGQNAFVIRYGRGSRFNSTWRSQGTEAMTIDDSGRVGFTAPAPNARFEIGDNGFTNNRLRIYNEGGSGSHDASIELVNADDGAGHVGGTWLARSYGWGNASLQLGGTTTGQWSGRYNISTTQKTYFENSGGVGIRVVPDTTLDVSGEITGRGGDTGLIFKSRNTSATGAPDQFKIEHNYGSVNISNPRGDINFTTALKQGGNTVATQTWVGNNYQPSGSYALLDHEHLEYLGVNAKAKDSNLLDGLDLHTGRNNEANKVVRTDANGYIQAGWINTTSGATTSTLSRIYASNDGYIRYVTPDEFRKQITDGIYQPAGSYAASSHNHNGVYQPAGSYAGVNGSYNNDFYGNAFYYDDWVRNHTNTNGIYWSTTGWHLYPIDNDDFRVRSGNSSSAALRFNTGGTDRNYVYNNNSNEIGFLSTSRGWIFKVTNSGTATATGDVVAFSDRRLKENIETIPNALEKVEALRGVTFTRKDTGKESIGLIAQEVEEVIPEVVNNEGEYKGVAYGNLVGVLIEAVKELSAEVKELKAKLGE